jgi:hypothetical protein
MDTATTNMVIKRHHMTFEPHYNDALAFKQPVQRPRCIRVSRAQCGCGAANAALMLSKEVQIAHYPHRVNHRQQSSPIIHRCLSYGRAIYSVTWFLRSFGSFSSAFERSAPCRVRRASPGSLVLESTAKAPRGMHASRLLSPRRECKGVTREDKLVFSALGCASSTRAIVHEKCLGAAPHCSI